MKDFSEGMEYSLAFRFHDQSPSYVHGFEAGQISALFEAKSPIEKYMAHTENLPTLHLMAEYYGHSLIVDPTAVDGWCEITAMPSPKKASELTLIVCPPRKCSHIWDGPEVPIPGGSTVTCSQCYARAIDVESP